MKEFGLQLWSIRDEFTTPERTRAAFKKMQEYGYTLAQTAGTYDYISPEDFRKYADEAGIRLVSTHYNFDRICNDVEGTARYHEILGAKEIGMGGYATPDFESLKAFIKKFNEMARIYYDNYGYQLAYHNHASEFSNQFFEIEGKRKYDYLMEELDPETTNFTVDSYWAQIAGIDVRALLERLAGRVKCLHLKDCQANCDFRTEDGRIVHAPERIEIGRGTMNFPALIKTAEATGVKYFIVEDEVYSTGNPLESVKMSADYIKAHLLEK